MVPPASETGEWRADCFYPHVFEFFLAEFFAYINYFQICTVKTAWGEDLLCSRRRIRGEVM